MTLRLKSGSITFCIITFVMCIIILCSCKPDQATLPVVSTTQVTDITGRTAVSGGTITDDGGSTVTEKGICWGTRANPTLNDSIYTAGQGIGAFTGILNNLLPNTTYNVRAYATNAAGTAYGTAISFRTSGLSDIITNSTVSDITATSAVCGGEVTQEGGRPVVAKGICWSTHTNPTINDNKTVNGTGVGSFTSNISGLTPGTTYFVTAYATTDVGTSYGKIIGFTTGKLPKVITNPDFSKITSTTAVCGGIVTSDGGETVLSRGVCWSPYPAPTIAGSKSDDGKYTGSFTSTLTGLRENTTYYVRAYAVTSSGVGYGEERTIKTWDPMQTITDVDGNVYHSIQVGAQLWLVENLKTTKYRNGDPIPTTSTATMDITSQIQPKYQWAYNGNESNVATFGRLYTSYAANDARNVAPVGWHVATKADWAELEEYLKSAGYKDAGDGNSKTSITKALAATTSWATNSTWANSIGNNLLLNNSTGFTSYPGGARLATGGFYDIFSAGHWWGLANNGSSEIIEHRLTSTNNYLFNFSAANALNYGFSIRCVKD